jgi:hypothetical protein
MGDLPGDVHDDVDRGDGSYVEVNRFVGGVCRTTEAGGAASDVPDDGSVRREGTGAASDCAFRDT